MTKSKSIKNEKRPVGRPRKYPVKEKRPVGRPQFAVNHEARQRVQILVGCGMTNEDVARAIGCDPKTLNVHFAQEIKYGPALMRAEVIDMLYESARHGNVSAQRKLLAITAGGDPDMKYAHSGGTISSEGERKPKTKLGKKEIRQQEAEAVSGIYDPPSPPKLVINNDEVNE